MYDVSLKTLRFINRILKFNFKDRPSATELLHDEYFKVKEFRIQVTLGQVIEEYQDVLS